MNAAYPAPGVASGVTSLGSLGSTPNFLGYPQDNIVGVKATVRTPDANTKLIAGTVLGVIATSGGAIVVAATGGNVGNGTIGTVTAGVGVMPGIYTVRFTTASSNGGQYVVTNPRGASVGIGNVGSAFSGGGIGFTASDGSTDYAVNDSFTLTVPAGTGILRISTAAATDGSNSPSAVLGHDVVPDGSLTDYEAIIYIAGPMLAEGLTYGAGHNAATVRPAFREIGLYI